MGMVISGKADQYISFLLRKREIMLNGIRDQVLQNFDQLIILERKVREKVSGHKLEGDILFLAAGGAGGGFYRGLSALGHRVRTLCDG